MICSTISPIGQNNAPFNTCCLRFARVGKSRLKLKIADDNWQANVTGSARQVLELEAEY